MDFAGEAQTIQVGSDNSYSGGLTVNLPIFAPALYKSINLTKADVDLAMEKARSSKLDLINQVTKAYYQLLLAQDSYEVIPGIRLISFHCLRSLLLSVWWWTTPL